MKRIISKAVCLLCAGALALTAAGCSKSAASSSTSASSEAFVYGSASDYDYQNFAYSDGLDENGYWSGIRALDYVTLPEDYASIPLKKADIEPTEEDVQSQIDSLLSQNTTTQQITDRAAADGDTVNIVYVKAPFNLQNMVMKDRQMLEKAFKPYGTEVKWHTITSGAKQGQAMAAGAIDVSAVMNTASLLMANGAGNSVLIANGVSHPADTFAIVGAKGEHYTVKDLKGKKIAGPRGTVLHQLLIAALVKEGMSAGDVTFVPMDIPAAMTAVVAGHADAALLAASAVIKAQEAGCEVITTAKGLVNVNLVMTAREGFAKDYPNALNLVVKTQRKALQWINGHWDEAVALGAKEHGIRLDDAKKLAQWSNYYDTLTNDDIKGLVDDQFFLVENGMMAKKVNVRTLVLPTALH